MFSLVLSAAEYESVSSSSKASQSKTVDALFSFFGATVFVSTTSSMVFEIVFAGTFLVVVVSFFPVVFLADGALFVEAVSFF